jgi:D-sedoheptulose 7-phosphate isomerase
MIREAFEQHARILAAMRSTQLEELQKAAELAESCLRAGGKILALGNGGSAADAQHFAAELVGRFERDRHPLPALALTVNTSTLTAIGNDYGFESVFERQVEALAAPGDLLLAITTSGNSPNVIAAASSARRLGCAVVGLTGESGGALAEWADRLIAVPSTNVARIQEMHEICLHALAAWLEARALPAGAGEEHP